MAKLEQNNKTIRAGVSKADITNRQTGCWNDLLDEKVKKHIPPDYLAKSVAVSDPMYARVLVLDDGGETTVMVTMDVTAIAARTISQNILADSADDFMPRLRARIEKELSIPGKNVNVSASHAHQVPRMLCDDEQQIARIVQAIREAKQNMVPVKIGIGSGREERLTFNRTLMLRDGTDWTVRSYHAPMPYDDQVEAVRPVDTEIGIIRIDRLDGSPLAVAYNFATHLSLGAPDGQRGTISADHVGVTLRYLESAIGQGVMAFFLQGAVGDVYEAPVFDTENPGTARDFGNALGKSALDAYHSTQSGAISGVRLVSRTVQLPLRKDIPQVIEKMKKKQAALVQSLQYTTLNFKAFLPLYLKQTTNPEYPSHWAYRYMHADAAKDDSRRNMDHNNKVAVEKYLQSIRAMENLAELVEDISTMTKHQEVITQLGTPSITAEFQAIRIGDSVWVTAPMEILSATALNLKRTSPFKRTFVMSLSNGYFHYAPPASYYPRGGYEVTECLLDPQWEQIFDGVVKDLFRELGG